MAFWDFIDKTVRRAAKFNFYYQTYDPNSVLCAKLLKCVFKLCFELLRLLLYFAAIKKQESNFRNLEIVKYFFALASNPMFQTLCQILCKLRKMQFRTFSFYFLISSLKIILRVELELPDSRCYIINLIQKAKITFKSTIVLKVF